VAAATTRAAPGTQLSVASFRAGGVSQDSAIAVSPAGGRVFVTGQSHGGPATGVDYKTVAYSAATGRQLWVSRYNGPANGLAGAYSVAVSPAGGTVFETGTGETGAGEYDATVAYRAATGRRLWASRRNGFASSVAVGPGGTTVFVTADTHHGYVTIAYRG
jgi:DNA-binding beta-propeller fold protein YncE